jgi:hypothetical protein
LHPHGRRSRPGGPTLASEDQRSSLTLPSWGGWLAEGEPGGEPSSHPHRHGSSNGSPPRRFATTLPRRGGWEMGG